MATASDVLGAALGEVGYRAYADPEPGSRYGRWMAEVTGEDWLRGPSTTVWWCQCFVSWCLARAGQECPGYPSYNTDSTLSRGVPLVDAADARPGDVVIWDWDGNGATDHVGLVLSHEPGGYGDIETVEGNYGNAVARVDRSGAWGCVAAVIRPPYGGGDAPAPSGGLAVDGYWGSATTRALQGHFGTPADGEVWHQARPQPACTSGWSYDSTGEGSPLVRAVQSELGVAADGLLGPETVRALQRRYGTPEDGELWEASPCVAAMQEALNAGEF